MFGSILFSSEKSIELLGDKTTQTTEWFQSLEPVRELFFINLWQDSENLSRWSGLRGGGKMPTRVRISRSEKRRSTVRKGGRAV